ncbi:MAG: DsbA family protein [Deltaproteobacteria bacterium]
MRGLSLLLLLMPAVTNAAPSRPVVAVFDIEAKGVRFSADELGSLSDYVSAQLSASGAFEVVPRTELKRALSAQKKESYRACYDEYCQIEIGKEVAAEKSVAGSVSKFGKSCIVTLRLFDLVKATAEAAGTRRGGCSPDAVLTSLEAAVADLSKRTSAPPRVTATTTEPKKTSPSKPGVATVEVFLDLECPYSKRLFDQLDSWRRIRPGAVEVRVRHFPLPFHKGARPAALAAIAADRQGKLLPMMKDLFAMQPKLTVAEIKGAARRTGLDMARFARDLKSADVRKQLQRDLAEGKKRGVRGTPTSFVNGERVGGANKKKIEELLKKAVDG